MLHAIFSNRIYLVSFIGSLLFLIFIVESVRKQKLKEAYSLIWLLIGSAFLIISIWSGALNYLSKFFGIAYQPATLFLVLIIMIILLLIQYSIVISKQTEMIKTLTQEAALLKKELEELTKQK